MRDSIAIGAARAVAVVALMAGLLLAGMRVEASGRSAGGVSHRPNAGGVPRPDHVVIVIEENHSYSEIIGSSAAPYINGLAGQGALFTNSYAIEHPSQPNYLDFFSGSNQGVTSDNCPYTFSTANLGSELLGAGLTFAGYSEDLPAPGSTVCTSGAYARKHNPWVNFTNVPTASNLQFTSFPTDYSRLPAISFVIPNQNNDMHNGTIGQGDTWLQQRVGPYIQWIGAHNSVLILTFDEDDSGSANRIATIFLGPMVTSGQYSEHINHFNVLRTLEDMYDLPYAGQSASAATIADVWISGTVTVTPSPPPSSPTPSLTPSLTPTATTPSTATDSPTTTPTTTPTDTPTAPATAIESGTPTATSTSASTPTTTSTPTSCEIAFTDVLPSDYFYEPMRHLFCRGVISGYGDNTFRPYNNTTRGQLTKIVALSEGWAPYTPPVPTFQDVPVDNAFYAYVETAYHQGVISGYSCGPDCLEFRPGSNVTRGQLCKIVALANGWPTYTPPNSTFTDVPETNPFYTYIETAYNRNIISGYTCGPNCLEFRPGNYALRAQIAKIVYQASEP
ncbi:MAG: alkaline phosphatase family protein [Chloroflexia bacterium]